jgi:hypothetical protein
VSLAGDGRGYSPTAQSSPRRPALRPPPLLAFARQRRPTTVASAEGARPPPLSLPIRSVLCFHGGLRQLASSVTRMRASGPEGPDPASVSDIQLQTENKALFIPAAVTTFFCYPWLPSCRFIFQYSYNKSNNL